jgi:hypothetical protein
LNPLTSATIVTVFFCTDKVLEQVESIERLEER